MDQWVPSDGFRPRPVPDDPCTPIDALPSSCPHSRYKVENDSKDNITTRRVQKADREKLRRDRLNEQFQELGNALDPGRPKNDKATVLTDAIQVLKDLTTQVNKLKAEYASLSDESHELTLEKNELKEEKATLKAEIDRLNAQHEQKLGTLVPWPAVDPSVVMRPPSYQYPLPVHVPSRPMVIHPSLQPYPFFPNYSAASIPNLCPTFLPFSSHCNPQVELPPTSQASSHPQPTTSRSQVSSCLQDSTGRFSDQQQNSPEKEENDFSNVVTELELKMPGSTPASRSESTHRQESCSKGRKGPWSSGTSKGSGPADANSTSRCSASYVLQDSSSTSVGDGSVDEN